MMMNHLVSSSIINQSSMMEYDKNIKKYKISTIAISQWLMLM